jgi:hypothetical protein
MQDSFTEQPTLIRGRHLPDTLERSALQDHHERRLEALARLSTAAEKCDLRTSSDPDRDLFLLEEDEVSLLEAAGAEWANLGNAIRNFRQQLPIIPLEDFGFDTLAENPLEEPNSLLHRIGGGVEAWAYASDDGSVYKFYLPREEKRIGSVFKFSIGEEAVFSAQAGLGDYQGLLEKLLLIHALHGTATEVVAITPEGIVVAKQTLGDPLPQGDDMSQLLPPELIEIPSRFLRANRDHPRLFFLKDRAWLIADLHARNFVRCEDGQLRIIDLVAAPWPSDTSRHHPIITDWIKRVQLDPHASVLVSSPDDEL